MRVLLAMAALLLAGCTAPVDRADPAGQADPPSTAAPDEGPASPSAGTPTAADRPVLARVRVTRDGSALRFHALQAGPGRRRVLVEGDGVAPPSRTPRPSPAVLWAAFPPSPPLPRGLTEPLLAWEVGSLQKGVRVVVAGGDGATLFPFEQVLRSEDPDDWAVTRAPRFGGAMAYLQGGVGLADGRLVVLLGAFSDDRAQRPADRHHGLWVSAGHDWSSYRPLRPRFVAWAVTSDHRLYVSLDRLRTFREVEVR